MKLLTSSRTLKTGVLALLLAGTLAYPARTYAILGIGDIVFDPTLIAKEYALDPAAFLVNKVAIQSLTKSVVNWIDSGFEGSPAFVQDLNKTLLDLGDAQAEQFIREFSSSGELSNVPWRDEIAQSVLSNYFRNTSRDGFYLNNPYTLDRVSSDPEAFIRGDYSKGGLNAWMSVVLNPGNNPLALRQNVEGELQRRISSAQQKKITELNWGDGYSSYRNCSTKSTSGSSLGGNLAASDASGSTGGSSSLGVSATTKTTSLNTASKDCSNQPILTPGALIARAANKYIVDQGLDTYISNDELSEVIASLLGNLVGSVLGSGGLKGVSEPSSGGGRSYLDRATDPSETSRAQNSLGASTDFLTTLSNQVTALTQFKADWAQLSSAANNARSALGDSGCSLVEETIVQAGTKTVAATSALSALESVRVSLTQNIAQDPTSQQALVASALVQYQQALASPTFPTANDIAFARSESQPRQKDTTAGTDASLYTKLVDISTKKTCST